jgi:FMN phosphatase YigB (HAD superfamily)
MKIVLDFDDTIFNTRELIQCFFWVFKQVGFSSEEFFNGFEMVRKKRRDFDLPTFVDLLNEKKPFDKKSVKSQLDAIVDKSDILVYPDFLEFVRKFDKDSLMILSFGTTPFQKTKIERSNILPFFGEVIITDKNKDEDIGLILKKYNHEKIFFVEDKATQIDMVKRKFPEVVVMKMERPEGRFNDIKSEFADFIVRDFNDVEKIIRDFEKF